MYFVPRLLMFWQSSFAQSLTIPSAFRSFCRLQSAYNSHDRGIRSYEKRLILLAHPEGFEPKPSDPKCKNSEPEILEQ